MADIRTLTTVFGFRVDQTGLKQYETVITKIKGLALEAGKLFGLYFAVDKVGEFIAEVVSAGKEMNRINTQIQQLTRDTDNYEQIVESLQNTARSLGIEYNKIADTFRDFLNDSQESNLTQQELLTTTDNVFKSMKVGRASAEQMAEGLSAINRALRMGTVGSRLIGTLLDIPGLSAAVVAGSGKTREELTKLAKDGKFTGEMLIRYLAKPNAELNKQFDAMPKKLGDVIQNIKDDLALSISYVWKLTQGFSGLGKVVWWTYITIRNAIKGIIDVLGGLQSALQIVGIALTLVLGPWVIRQLYLMAARFTALAITSWAIWAPWLAIGAAIVIAALAIQDFMLWMSGDKKHITRFGEWLGPFDQFQKKIQEFVDNSPFFAFIRSIKEALAGNWTGAIEELKKALGSVEGVLGAILTLVSVSIPVAFGKWALLNFGTLVARLIGVRKAAEAAAAAANAAGSGKAAPGAAAPGAAVAPVTTPKGIGFWKGLGLIGTAGATIAAGIWGKDLMEGIKDWGIDKIFGPGTAEKKRTDDEEIRKRYQEDYGFWGIPGLGWLQDKLSGITQPVGKDEAPVGTFKWLWQQMKGEPQSAAFPQVQPFNNNGAQVTAPVNNVTTTVSPTYNITATVQPDEQFIADMIQQRVQQSTPDMAGQISRQIQDAIPRTERATQ